MPNDGSTSGAGRVDVLSQLATAVASTTWEAVPAEAQERALALLLDSLSVMAGGSAHPDMRSLRASVAAPTGPCTVFGESGGAGVHDAVLLNAATITVLQRQDGYSRH